MNVLLVASDKSELKGFSDNYIKVVSGVGPIMAAVKAAKEIVLNKPDVVISVGSAGAISRDLKKGEAYSFKSVVTPDQDLSVMHLECGVTIDGRRTTVGSLDTRDRSSSLILASSGTFASVVTDKHKTLKVDAADMEAYGVGMAARDANIPFFAVKLITDYVGDSSTVGDIQFNMRDARAKLIQLVEELLS